MTERWKPKKGEYYSFVNDIAIVQTFVWTDSKLDRKFYETGNCFRTRAEAEAAAEKLKTLLLGLHNEQDSIQDMVTNTCQAMDKGKENVAKATCTFGNLPKLTADVFDRPDCPEWAKWAAVNMCGIGCFYENEPSYDAENYKGFWYVATGRARVMKDITFDYTDLQNSLIERPKNRVNWDEVEEILCNSKLTFKEKKPSLPDWCKPGAWIYTSSEQYLKVIGISIDLQKIELSNGAIWRKQDIIDEAVSARLRPYNAEEIPDLPFEVTERNSNFRTTVISCKGNKVWLALESTPISTEELMRGFTAKGEPCGVLEHLWNWEWVK